MKDIYIIVQQRKQAMNTFFEYTLRFMSNSASRNPAHLQAKPLCINRVFSRPLFDFALRARASFCLPFLPDCKPSVYIVHFGQFCCLFMMYVCVDHYYFFFISDSPKDHTVNKPACSLDTVWCCPVSSFRPLLPQQRGNITLLWKTIPVVYCRYNTEGHSLRRTVSGPY